MNLNSVDLDERCAAVLHLVKHGFRPLGHGQFVRGSKVYQLRDANLKKLNNKDIKQFFVRKLNDTN